MIHELLLCCVIILLVFVYRRRIPVGLPPGEWGWPIVGFLPFYKEPLSNHVNKFIKKFGKTFTWRIGTHTHVLLCDYKTLKSAFNDPNLTNRPSIFGHDAFSGFQKLGITNNNGVSWRNVKRFTLRHLKDKGMGKSSLEQVIAHETLFLLADFQKHTDKITTIPWSVNVAIINILWGIIAGRRYEVDDKKFQELQKLITDLNNDFQSFSFLLFNLFPWLNKLIPHTLKGYLGLGGAFRRLASYRSFLMETITEHKRSLDENNPKDYIDSYLIELNLHQEHKGGENTSTFTDGELLYALSDLFVAGSETTASTIRWILIYLIKYPEIQLKVQRQIDEVVPRDRLPSLQDREKLPYVDATFYEVMRIKTLAPFGAPHMTREDMTIDNYRIPKGTPVIAAIEACHNDPDYWDQPHQFNPDRFILPDGSCNSKKDGFIPFGTGRRACIGESLAKMELYLIGSALLQKFNFSSPEGVDVILDPDPFYPIFHLPKPCKVIIKERI